MSSFMICLLADLLLGFFGTITVAFLLWLIMISIKFLIMKFEKIKRTEHLRRFRHLEQFEMEFLPNRNGDENRKGNYYFMNADDLH